MTGRVFRASSPNGRFPAATIDGKLFASIEAVGKNLFAFFGVGKAEVCVHVHFGMAGNWGIFAPGNEPETTPTTRLRLEAADDSGLTSHLSAMTVTAGGRDLFVAKRAKLGQDPLRDDANPEALWDKVRVSSKSIGALVMDQAYFCGPGNIYRAELLFKAGVHPDRPGRSLDRAEFDVIWGQAVALLRRGYETGSIVTVDDSDALHHPELRRYVYAAAHCPRCGSKVVSWEIAARKCFACPTCQPRNPTARGQSSSAAPIVAKQRSVAQLRAELRSLGAPANGKKADLVARLDALRDNIVSAEDAAREKILAGESRAVEHVADIHPSQATALVVTPERARAKKRRLSPSSEPPKYPRRSARK